MTDVPTPPVREPLATAEAPTPTGPFSQAIRTGSFIFTAGQAGRNRDTGQMGDLAEQTTWALRNLEAILKSGGATLDDVVKVTIYLREGENPAELNAVYQEMFTEPRPARSLVYVSRLKGPDMRVEIEVIAAAG